jgi:hypothetical protein
MWREPSPMCGETFALERGEIQLVVLWERPLLGTGCLVGKTFNGNWMERSFLRKKRDHHSGNFYAVKLVSLAKWESFHSFTLVTRRKNGHTRNLWCWSRLEKAATLFCSLFCFLDVTIFNFTFLKLFSFYVIKAHLLVFIEFRNWKAYHVCTQWMASYSNLLE